ncbi:MAG: ABC transporter ATP-binding protein [Actinobacteria bacterium]|nr:ABC transporter ATP-binding protein [Actinomycetota bacterium]
MSATVPKPAASTYAIEVQDLRVDLPRRNLNVVKDVSFRLRPGEILGLIGESGSGKTTVASALLGYVRKGGEITGGSVVIDGVDVLSLDERKQRTYRGGVISYVPQDPGGSLNPVMRIGAQLDETLAYHGVGKKDERAARIGEILDEVKLPGDADFLHRCPHELSGGQQQRIAIAMAFLCRPRVVVLDEPTTGLDVTTQAYVLQMVRTLCREHKTAGVYASHDLAVVADIADEIAVMYFGRLVEFGPARAIMSGAGHPYSRGLVRVIPDPSRRRPLEAIRGRVPSLDERGEGCVFADRCDFVEARCRAAEIEPVQVGADHVVRCLRVEAVRGTSARAPVEEVTAEAGGATATGYLNVRELVASYDGHDVLHGIDLAVPKGLVTALVGESGSGKTTLARCIAGLHEEARGDIEVAGERLKFGSHRRTVDQRKAIQYIFQNATEALNPRRTVGHAIAQPLRVLENGKGERSLDERVVALLDEVSLNPYLAGRYPSQLSGGERQRVTIARALATGPSVLICDEITSALDVSVQAAILMLLKRLRAESDLTLLFVTHNLAVVRAIADRVAVLNEGRIVEEGPVEQVLDSPRDPYTRQLLHDTPALVNS